MFIGHFAVAFAAKRVAPRTSLGTLFIGAQVIDLLWPTLLLLGLERVRIDPTLASVPLVFTHYPISHSLLAVLGWAILLGAVYFALTRYARGAIVLAALVLSHWLLDALVHRPDLPLLAGGETLVGLGLWEYPFAAMAIELTLFAVCFGIYLGTPAGRAAGRRPWYLAFGLVLIYLGNFFGPPPPSWQAIAWIGQAQWLLVLAGYWADRAISPSGAASARA
jgi:membrane-bound metal-dependent hydrolase YbcI (DUF457 family)